ncbi:glycerate kinase [Exiguobacterium sp. s193]|uniref:glycerate kinase n=1 Tax=Exiguobacterium sp. s193 TaxID=2751207 RepID=UPI001BED367E|nr:glycerate kinase [Exiguobacterium sp. s193]
MHHLVIIDSFKGSVSSKEAALAVRQGILQADSTATVDWSPGADGGEGTLEMLFENGFSQVEAKAIDLAGRPIRAVYAQNNKRVVIEVARACGLGQVEPGDQRFHLNTRGVGRIVRHAMQAGATEIFLALGGTGTTDGGLGLLYEVGATLLDAKNRPVTWTVNPLLETEHIILPKLPVQLHVLADVIAPYAGERGAAKVFGPQKGLTATEIELLDTQLERVGNLLGVNGVAGAGAAGGLGGAAFALGADIQSGAAFLLGQIEFERRLAVADYVWTGEGKLDLQTTLGKLPGIVRAQANQAGIPCVMLAGRVEQRDERALICASIHDVGEEVTLDSKMTGMRLARRAKQITQRLGKSDIS